jgi:hypothetical protein
MPTLAQITAASGTLDATAQGQWLTLIRVSPRYRDNPGLYPDLAGKLASVSALQAKQLNAALTLIDEVGDGTVAILGGRDALDFSQDRDRQALVDYGISVLYDSPVKGPAVTSGQMTPIASCCPLCGGLTLPCRCALNCY